MKTMWLLAGPNGAGKTTFFNLFLARRAAPFINADVIARELDRANPEAASYRAAEIAAERRSRMLADGRSFVTETVFSHPSKLELVRDARAHGFYVWLIYIAVGDVDTSIERVRRRKRLGGHDVPADKIAARTQRSLTHLSLAVTLADRVDLYDNSDTDEPYRRLCRWDGGALVWRASSIPAWVADLFDGR